MKKRALLLIMTLLLVLAMVGCGSPAPKAEAPKAEAPKTEAPKTEAPKADAKAEQLIIYSNSASNGRGEWLKERAAKEGFNIEVVSLGGGDLTNRLIAEKNNSLADLVYGLNALEYEKLKKEDLLMKYEPTWKKDVDMTFGDAQGYYYPIVVQPLVLIYNKELKDAPKDWTDLTDAKYKDKYNIFSLGGGTSKTILASILTRYLDEKGELGVSKEGWEVAKKYVQNAHFEVKGEDYVGNVISNERPMTMMWGSGVIQNQNERKYEFGVMSPEIGVPYVVEQVAIISKTKKAELATKFANWFGSEAIQTEWCQKFGTIPANPNSLKAAPKEVTEFMAKVKPQKMDWTVISNNMDKWIEKVELEFKK